MNLNTSERAAPRSGPATVNVLVATATKSIQAIGSIECADIRKVLDTLIAQMQASGFGLLDVNTLANAADFICGQADYGDSLDAMHDAINGLGLTSRIQTAQLVAKAERAAV